LVFSIVSFAQEEGEAQEEVVTEEEDTKNKIVASPHVSVYSVFPTSPSKQFETGKLIQMVLGFHNKAPNTNFNISQVFASLRHPYDWRVSIQNFTRYNPFLIATRFR